MLTVWSIVFWLDDCSIVQPALWNLWNLVLQWWFGLENVGVLSSISIVILSRGGLSANFNVDVICLLVMTCTDVHHAKFIFCKHCLKCMHANALKIPKIQTSYVTPFSCWSQCCAAASHDDMRAFTNRIDSEITKVGSPVPRIFKQHINVFVALVMRSLSYCSSCHMQVGIADFDDGNEWAHQHNITGMQDSHDTLIVLDKHKLQFRLNNYNIANLLIQPLVLPIML